MATLPVVPPLAPMLARLEPELPEGGFAYEPKWDGFRCLAFRDGPAVDLRSRHDRPLARYFPEVVEAVLAVGAEGVVLDGEIVPAAPGGFDFAALMSRLHPAPTRVARLRRELPAAYVAFDLLAFGDEGLLDRPDADRRRRLEALLLDPPPGLSITPRTLDPAAARGWLAAATGAGIDGVVAKPLDGPYQPGRRANVKVKPRRTADCVVAGVRLLPGGRGVSSLLLGLYDEADALRHVGVVTSFPAAERRAILVQLRPGAVPLAAHPWRQGFLIAASPLGRLKGSAGRWTPDMEPDWLPIRPERVVEVAFSQVDGDRFRHPARLVRWRPDREATTCRIDQLALPRVELAAALALA